MFAAYLIHGETSSGEVFAHLRYMEIGDVSITDAQSYLESSYEINGDLDHFCVEHLPEIKTVSQEVIETLDELLESLEESQNMKSISQSGLN